MNKLIIMDGNSLANRAFYALPPLTDRNGLHTHAIFGFWTMTLRVLQEEQATHWIVVFDAAKRNFRHELYDGYKGQREKTPSELGEQFPVLKQMLRESGVCVIEQEGFEADDLIGTITLQASAQGYECLIITGDKDLLQIADQQVEIGLTRKGISELEKYKPTDIQAKYGLAPLQIIDLKGLMGDPSDNIPGVPGVGEKTALKLLHTYQSVENLLNHLDELKGKQQEQLIANADLARLSKTLATIKRDVPMSSDWTDSLLKNADAKNLLKWFQQLNFKSLYDRIPNWSGNVSDGSSHDIDLTSNLQLPEVVWVSNSDALKNAVVQLANCSTFWFESHGENPHHADLLVACFGNDQQLFVIASDQMKAFFENPQTRLWLLASQLDKNVFDFHKTLLFLNRFDLGLQGAVFDALLSGYLLDPTISGHQLDEIAAQYETAQPFRLNTEETIYGKGAKFALPETTKWNDYLARKNAVLIALRKPMLERIQQEGMQSLYSDLELPLSAVLAQLEKHGVAVDRAGLIQLGEAFRARLDDLTSRIYASAGMQFNINSPKQLGEVLFEKLMLPPVKKTKTGYSTDAEVLEKLALYHEVVSMILDYRQVAKLLSTYVEGLQHEIHPTTERVHTYFHQTLTATGRLSSQYPNLQNIPIRMEEGRQLRRVFIPREQDQGWRILAADYSQIELRVLAHMSEDPALIHAFQDEKDIHTQTAATVFDVPIDHVDQNMRRQAKAVNFGIIYGMSDFGLSQNLNITRKAAAQFIDQYFAAFPNVKGFMDRVIREARERGYVTTLLNRRRYLPDLKSSNFNARSFAERMAMNTPIQGSAADLIKLAMIKLANAMQERELQSRMLLQVHDELVFEVPPTELETMQKLVRETMEQAYPLLVPLKVEVNDGANWYETK